MGQESGNCVFIFHLHKRKEASLTFSVRVTTYHHSVSTAGSDGLSDTEFPRHPEGRGTDRGSHRSDSFAFNAQLPFAVSTHGFNVFLDCALLPYVGELRGSPSRLSCDPPSCRDALAEGADRGPAAGAGARGP